MKKVKVVGAVIVNKDNHVLCALRSQSMSLPGLWEFPGGKIEPGEEPKDALVRELQEELNCTVVVGDKVTSVDFEYPAVFVNLTTYYATIVDGTPCALEHEKLVWLEAQDIPQLEWAPADQPTVEIITSAKNS